MAKKKGRPEKLTTEEGVDSALVKTMLAYLKMGSYVETAAAAAGINKDTLYRWLRNGAPGNELKDPEGKYRAFSDAIQKSKADGEILHLKTIYDAAHDREIVVGFDKKGKPQLRKIPGQWQASAWMLERKDPQRWGRRERVDLSLTDRPEDRDVEARKLVVEMLGKLSKPLLKLETGEGDGDDDESGNGDPATPGEESG